MSIRLHDWVIALSELSCFVFDDRWSQGHSKLGTAGQFDFITRVNDFQIVFCIYRIFDRHVFDILLKGFQLCQNGD